MERKNFPILNLEEILTNEFMLKSNFDKEVE